MLIKILQRDVDTTEEREMSVSIFISTKDIIVGVIILLWLCAYIILKRKGGCICAKKNPSQNKSES